MSPAIVDAAPGTVGMGLGTSCQLPCQDSTQVNALCILVAAGTRFLVQFFAGPVGSMPAVHPSTTT
jgi:hypothetical protein